MLAKIGAGVLGASLAVCVGVIVAIYAGGIATIAVSDGEDRFKLPLPVVLADLAVATAGKGPLQELRTSLLPYREVLSEAMLEIELSPDVVLVEVLGNREKTRIEKKGSQFIIDVLDNDEHVSISVPVRSVRRLLDRFLN